MTTAQKLIVALEMATAATVFVVFVRALRSQRRRYLDRYRRANR